MEGIVSLLDGPHYTQVEQIWSELEREFGLRGVYATPYPHFSYQVAEQYDLTRLEAALHGFAAHQRPFDVTTSGLGIFTGPTPVLYISLVRTTALDRFHTALHQATSPAAHLVQAYYEPDSWQPHITIGFGDLAPESAAAAVRHLAGRSFGWVIHVDNLALIQDRDATGQQLRLRCSLTDS